MTRIDRQRDQPIASSLEIFRGGDSRIQNSGQNVASTERMLRIAGATKDHACCPPPRIRGYTSNGIHRESIQGRQDPAGRGKGVEAAVPDRGGSLFTEQPLWTRSNFDELRTLYVENLDDESSDSFLTKLERQLRRGSPDAKCLWAEMMWVYLLIVRSTAMAPGTKRNGIREIWKWVWAELPRGPCPAGRYGAQSRRRERRCCLPTRSAGRNTASS